MSLRCWVLSAGGSAKDHKSRTISRICVNPSHFKTVPYAARPDTYGLMRIYLDHNAAAPLLPEAAAAVTKAMALSGNPSSIHGLGRAVRRMIEDARATLAECTGARAEDIAFTASGSEACQLMLNVPGRSRILASATEHAAILEAAPHAEILPVLPNGLLDIAALTSALGDDGSDAIVAVMLANNETGALQPIAEIAECVHAKGGLLAVDAAQAFGKTPVVLADLNADMLAFSSAKIGGPLGAGAAVFRKGVVPKALLTGGGQERGLRGGSENVLGIAGFGGALAALDASLAAQPQVARLRDQMEAAVLSVAPDAVLNGLDAPRLATTASIAMPGVDAATQVMAMDLAGIAVSAGAACSSGKVAASHVLEAMGLRDDIAGGTIRISLGLSTTEADIEAFVAAWTALYMRRNANSAGT